MDEWDDRDRRKPGDDERVPFARVLAPLDGSEAVLGALGWAAAVAGADGEIMLLEVTPAAENVRSVIGREIATAGQVQDGYTRTASQRLTDAAASLPDGVRTRILVETGNPAEEILRIAEREDADLVALTFSGAGAWGPFARVQVMARVARSAWCPVLVVPSGSEPGRIGEILVPIDGTEAALAALSVAAELGAALGAEIHVVQVVDTASTEGSLPDSAVGIAHPDVVERELRGATRAVAEAAVAAAVDRLRRLRVPVRGSVPTGNPVATAVAMAERSGGSALVVAARRATIATGRAGEGEGGPDHDRVAWTVGGVVDALLRVGTVPVVVVPDS